MMATPKNKGNILIIYILLLCILAGASIYLFFSAATFNSSLRHSTEHLAQKRSILHDFQRDMYKVQMSAEHNIEEDTQLDHDSLEALTRVLYRRNGVRLDSLDSLADNPEEQEKIRQVMEARLNLAALRDSVIQLSHINNQKATRFLSDKEIPAFDTLLALTDKLSDFQMIQGRISGESLSAMLDKNQRTINALLGISFIVLLAIGRVVYSREKLLSASRAENIVKRMEAETHLFRLSQAVEQSPATVVITDTDGNIQYVNRKFTETTGYSSEDAMGKNPRILKSGYTSSAEYEKLWKQIKSGLEWKGEFQNRKKNGELYWERARISPILNKDGEITNFLAIKEDITEHKKEEEQMKLLAEMLDNTPAAVTIHDFAGNYLWFNKKTIAYHGYTEEEIKALGVKGLNVQNSRELYDERIKTINEVGEATFEAEHFRKDGSTFPLEVTSKLIKWQGKDALMSIATDISERKQAELKLNENNLRLDLAMQSANMAWWEMDIKTGQVIFEKRKAEMLGYPPEMFKHYTDFTALVFEDDRKKAMIAMHDHITGKVDKYEVEYRILAKSGEYLWFYDIGGIVKRDLNGAPLIVAGIVINISARKQAEVEFMKLNKAIQSSGEAVFLTDREGIFTFINQGFTSIYGYTADELVGKTTPRIIKSELYPTTYYADFWKTLFSGKELKGEYKNKRKDGTLIEIEGSASPIFDEQKNIIGFLGIQSEITIRKKAETDLREAHDNIQLLLDSIAEGAYGVDTNGACTFVNKSFLRLMGFRDANEILGKQIHLLMHHTKPNGDNYPASECKMLNTRKTKEHVHVDDEVFWRKDGTRMPVEYWSYPIIKDEQIVGAICTFVDITERRKSEEEIKQLNTGLERKVEERTYELNQQKEIIEKKNKDITDSLQYAQRLQQALYPNRHLMHGAFKDSFIWNNPCEIVSGDFSWFHQNGNKIIVACVDCTGHGVPGAFMSIIGMEMMNRVVITKGIVTPAEILLEMDRELEIEFHQTMAGNIKDGMDVSICVIDKKENKIHFAGANHPIIMVSEGKSVVYRSNRFGIGKYLEKGQKHFETREIDFKGGDMLYLFSDGYRDQFGGENSKKMGLKSFAGLIEDLSQFPLLKQKEELEQRFKIWKGDNNQVDDVMVVGIELCVD